jgi:hypothetical protein
LPSFSCTLPMASFIRPFAWSRFMWISSLNGWGPGGARLPAALQYDWRAAEGFGRGGAGRAGPTGPQNGMRKALQVPDPYGFSFRMSFGSYKDMG